LNLNDFRCQTQYVGWGRY